MHMEVTRHATQADINYVLLTYTQPQREALSNEQPQGCSDGEESIHTLLHLIYCRDNVADISTTGCLTLKLPRFKATRLLSAQSDSNAIGFVLLETTDLNTQA
eukprot:1441420-Amphidinium_carterae.1